MGFEKQGDGNDVGGEQNIVEILDHNALGDELPIPEFDKMDPEEINAISQEMKNDPDFVELYLFHKENLLNEIRKGGDEEAASVSRRAVLSAMHNALSNQEGWSSEERLAKLSERKKRFLEIIAKHKK